MLQLNEESIRLANQIIENDAIRLKLNENLQKSLEEIVNDLMDKKDEKGLVELINNLPSCTVRMKLAAKLALLQDNDFS